MSRYRTETENLDYEKTSACTNFLHYSWKTITCLFSHITLVSMVVSYCVLGAFTFEALEVNNEKQVKRGIPRIRENVTQHLWNFTQELNALEEANFTRGAKRYLRSFENALLDAMTKDGWDGIEDEHKVQWTLTGSLFYSIIVITTIGYGHIAPKTTWGKVVTIFYAILGIPLMLLCLSNIGDIMATSFRFLYWRVCCYVCTKKPKKMKRSKSVRSGIRSDGSKFSRSRNASVRRSVRTSTKSADSGFAFSDIGPASHSDTELRYDDHPNRGVSLPRTRSYNKSQRASGNATPRKISQVNHSTPNHVYPQRGYSLDRKRATKDVEIELDPISLDNSSILCNRYVIGKNDGFAKKIPGKGITLRQQEIQNRANSMPADRRAKSMPRTPNYLEPPRISSPDEEEEVEKRGSRRSRSPMRKHKLPNRPSPSPRMMTPLGYGYKSKYLDDSDSDQDYDYYEDSYETGRTRIKPVPIWLCVFLVVGYILAGAYLFKTWENWEYLDAAYFCFITLTTIGFGDLVPAKGVSQDGYYATISIALCSLYLLFGISLLAMSFNLVQEEVISNVKSVAKTLGIIKSESDDEDDDG
ncbi:unnamed protein product [Phaedon cochleariae]|uniref:Potassium channel domain-containing protein n=1 Tax=Phaedon cochleariae TaxID=80249 RepID=A0A9P0D9Z1_PHACE|nr:unnamed protein product [Phaedon cochleariae]